MKRKIKNVFVNALTNDENFKNADIDEIKYSKKLNSTIIIASSTLNISYLDILNFEKEVCKNYDLKSCKVDYTYTGEKKEIDEEKFSKIVEDIQKEYDYTPKIFNGFKVNIDNDIKRIEVILDNEYANFLYIKKVDKYIIKSILIEYGTEYKVSFLSLKEVEVGSSPQVVKIDRPVISKENLKKVDNVDKQKKEESSNNSVSTTNTNTYNSGYKKEYAGSNYPKRVAFKEKNAPEFVIKGKDITKERVTNVIDLHPESGAISIEGIICEIDIREIKNGNRIFTVDLYDGTGTIACKTFCNEKEFEELSSKVTKNNWYKLKGNVSFDTYANEITMMIESINTVEAKETKKRKDEAKEKRVELHIHTQMSAMDGVASATDIVKQAIKWGHRAVAITDHGVVQSFPEAHQVISKTFYNKEDKDWLKNAPTKVLYGVEGYLSVDCTPQITHTDTFCVFDIETTGFHAGIDKITEIAVAKVRDGKIIDEFTCFVNPERPIPKEVQELTHITEEMVESAETIEQVLPKFLEFTKDSILVAHNSKFDMGFITHFAKGQGLSVTNNVIDTLVIARELFESYENHKLGTIAKNLGIDLEGAHRAINDVRATVEVFVKMMEIAKEKNINIYDYIYNNLEHDLKKTHYNHVIIIAKNYTGLKNLYKLISFSHLHFFYKKPQILKSMLNRYREGLIVGSACEQGELYQAILKYKDINVFEDENAKNEVESIAKYYDYLEVQPLGNNQFYVDRGILNSTDDLIKINKIIIELGKKLNIPVVATTDAHFLNKEDEIYRKIIMAGQGYEDADKQPPLYFRTTGEMYEEFSYLDDETKKEIIVTNPNKIADMCEAIQPVPDGTFPPSIEGSEEDIKRISYETAKQIYGDNLPEIVEKRLEKELVPIIKYGFAVMYMIARKLVKKSNSQGYLVGSRGSVGSSFVATMTGITEVNPLPPHYICQNEECKYSEFPETTVTTGIDMEDKICPKCGKPLKKDGMDIPFETFLGFKGDKAPDIDLNFSGDNQASAHAYTEELFGKSKTFRAGTIGTVAEKTAYGFVKKYFEETGKRALNPEINRLAKGCTGVKRTTGQHPGGIIVVPDDKDIYDFTPIQKPADDMFSKSITTHFDFHSIHDNLLKLDILGHDDPTVIRMLQDLTGVDPKTIPLDEKKVMSLFSSTDALGVTPESIKSEVGTYAVPEFGTKFVRQMLLDTRPTTFGELVRISGLSHGTDVWLGNAQTLIQEGTATLREAICTRDDIMIYLIQQGLEPQISFKTMESVRKGKGLTEEMEAAMREKDVPDWYIDSCKKIKYMFPKAHACAYVMMAYRIAYFKVYYPKEFYATYLTVRADNFSSELMIVSKEKIKENIRTYEQMPNASATDKDSLSIMEVINEMLERNVKFLKVDIYKSDAAKFLVEEDGIRPPLSALTGFGLVDATKLVKERENGKFETIEEVAHRAKIGKVAMQVLEDAGCFEGMAKSSQINFFD